MKARAIKGGACNGAISPGLIASATRACEHAALALLVVAVLYLCLLLVATLVLGHNMHSVGAGPVTLGFLAPLAMVLMGGTVKGALFFWLSAMVKRGRAIGWAIGIVAFFLAGDCLACGFAFAVARSRLATTIVIFHGLGLAAVLAFLFDALRKTGRSRGTESSQEPILTAEEVS